MGGWNLEKQLMLKRMCEKEIDIDYAVNMTQETRCVAGEETNKIIDYAICNKKDLILTEKWLKDWHISDIYPIETMIDIRTATSEQEKRYLFDRRRLKQSSKIRNRI